MLSLHLGTGFRVRILLLKCLVSIVRDLRRICLLLQNDEITLSNRKRLSLFTTDQ